MTHQIDWRSMFKNVLKRMREAGESNEMGARWMATEADHAVHAALAAKYAEIEKLKAALEPFSDAAENLDPTHRDGSPIWESPAAMGIDAKHLRDARAALKGDAA